MKRKATRILAMLLTALLVLSACGGNNNQPADNNNANTPGNTDNTNTTPTEPPAPSNGGEPIKDLVTWESSGTRELEEFFILHTERAADLNVLCNAYSPLLEIDNYGKLQPAVATKWGSEDGKTWTFELRDDVTWVDVNGSYKANVAAGMSNEQMWYSGAYTLTTYISSNEKVLTRNPAYFDKDCTRFDTVTIRVVESALVDDQPLKPGLHLQGLCVL